MILGAKNLKMDQVQRNFSRHADAYDRYARVQKRVVDQLLRYLPLDSLPGKTLEVGCGTGLLSRRFLQRYPDVQLVLSDLAHGMSCRAAGRFPQQSVIDADAQNLPFVGESFDLVLSSSVYQWVDPLAQAFWELDRVLRPGGRVALALFGAQTLFELRYSHAFALAGGTSHFQEFPDCHQVRKSIPGRFEIELFENQFEVEWHPEVPHLLRSLKAIGAQNASRHRPEGLGARSTMQSMYDCYTQRFGRAGQIPATYEVIYLILRKPGVV
jgi:malonyl-CoA O-methyltransferase